jgi:hypothetical protein
MFGCDSRAAVRASRRKRSLAALLGIAAIRRQHLAGGEREYMGGCEAVRDVGITRHLSCVAEA